MIPHDSLAWHLKPRRVWCPASLPTTMDVQGFAGAALFPWAHPPATPFLACHVYSCFKVQLRHQFFPDRGRVSQLLLWLPSVLGSLHPSRRRPPVTAPPAPERSESRGPHRPGPQGASRKL